MSRKKDSELSISETEHTQVQQQLEHYQELAATLRQSSDQAQAESALAEINALPESTQFALMRALTKEQTVDAADLLTAINAFSPQKEVRKEARRALIRLETHKVSSRWNPPITSTPAIQVNVANPPRFWKGYVTQARDQGEVELMLLFEQGYDYTEIHNFVFLLDFWQFGVKDAIVGFTNKRRANENLEHSRGRLQDVALVECTLAEGKRLLEEALSVNTWRKTQPHEDYRKNLTDINRLILEALDFDKDRGLTFIAADLEFSEIPVFFLGGWSMGDYGLTYDLLAKNGSVRNGLTRDEWIEQHRAWANEAQPARMELGFVREHEKAQSALWLPSSPLGKLSTTRKEVEIGWSLELADTPLGGVLKELPMGTAINKETGRHWFWTSYTLVREDDVWRIQHIADEGSSIQGLPIPELQKRQKEQEDRINETTQQPQPDDINAAMEELSWRITQLLHYDDALIARLPFDRATNELAMAHSIAIASPERTMVYLERLATRFPEQHAELLRQLGATITMVAGNYNTDTPEMKERYDHLMARAESILREALTVDNGVIGHLLLAELLLSLMRETDAEIEIQQAREREPNASEEATIEALLGSLAMRRELFEDAIQHFQRTSELDPNRPGIWFSLGFAHRLLGHNEQAEECYSEAIQRAPQDIRSYTELIALYMNQQRKLQARGVAEQAVQMNPDSEVLHALFASVLYELGETREAKHELEEAEKINPEHEIVASVRDQFKKRR